MYMSLTFPTVVIWHKTDLAQWDGSKRTLAPGVLCSNHCFWALGQFAVILIGGVVSNKLTFLQKLQR